MIPILYRNEVGEYFGCGYSDISKRILTVMVSLGLTNCCSLYPHLERKKLERFMFVEFNLNETLPRCAAYIPYGDTPSDYVQVMEYLYC